MTHLYNGLLKNKSHVGSNYYSQYQVSLQIKSWTQNQTMSVGYILILNAYI